MISQIELLTASKALDQCIRTSKKYEFLKQVTKRNLYLQMNYYTEKDLNIQIEEIVIDKEILPDLKSGIQSALNNRIELKSLQRDIENQKYILNIFESTDVSKLDKIEAENKLKELETNLIYLKNKIISEVYQAYYNLQQLNLSIKDKEDSLNLLKKNGNLLNFNMKMG
ncbi:hypothetical protein BBF96_15555 [Anoxybacter fermentans]|uniref:Uncharacterized protein n=1 Tax=Anoxybacter fermentans TaxID=1323375 RepID=A0A3Q9HSM3_9FIRM|nr:hypothetical protein [Anoxybacter fermentans]AZR74664.1 hypothetical protein BBF96_15555 [Anoxybacter fermentans]